MPRVSRKNKRRRRPVEYTPRHLRELKTGLCDHFNDLFDGDLFPPKTIAWAELRDELMPAFIAEHPGQRPYAWWLFDSPGRRERIDGKPHPHDHPGYPTHLKKLIFGKPSCFSTHDESEAEYEDEEDYLRRHGLLTPAEM